MILRDRDILRHMDLKGNTACFQAMHYDIKLFYQSNNASMIIGVVSAAA